MRSVFDFIVKPVEGRYDNEIKVGDKKLMLNSSIEDFKFISRKAEVVSVPIAFNSSINVGDIIIIHHNVFRRYYNQKGEAVDSSKLFKENLYFCQPDQVYLYKRDNKWRPIGTRCFVMPIKNNNPFSMDKERKHIGVLKIGNKSLEALSARLAARDAAQLKKATSLLLASPTHLPSLATEQAHRPTSPRRPPHPPRTRITHALPLSTAPRTQASVGGFQMPKATSFPSWFEGTWDAEISFRGFQFPPVPSLSKETVVQDVVVAGFQKLSIAMLVDVGRPKSVFTSRWVRDPDSGATVEGTY